MQAHLVFPKLAGAPNLALRGFTRVHLKAGESRNMPLWRSGRRTARGVALALLAGIVALPTMAAGGAAPPADGAGAFATGKYRNLFVEGGHTEADVDAKIARAWKQLFEGDPETERLFTPSGRNENGPLAYIPDIQHTDVRSEGMSYGMMIAVQLDRKAEFDALWNWSMTHMYQKDPKHPSCRPPTARSTT